jgi:predicted nucleic acid-binding protein
VIVVADASVALKWFFRTRADEADVGPALELLKGVADGRVELLEPPHFIAEMAAVLVREAPRTAAANLRDLLAIEMRIDADESAYVTAMGLADKHKHHLFDTLYHALALATPGAQFVTADEGYWRKARTQGAMVRLADFALAD